jgi:glutamate decarboxylase
MSNLTRTADYLSDSLQALDFIIMSKKSGEGLPLVAFRLKPDEDRNWDEFALAHQLRSRSWVVPAYTMAPHTENLKMLRVVVREDFSKNRCDSLIVDIKLCMNLLNTLDKDSIKKHEDFIRRNQSKSHQSTHNHPKFQVSHSARNLKSCRSHTDRPLQNEKHSIQGKHGKTHAVC